MEVSIFFDEGWVFGKVNVLKFKCCVMLEFLKRVFLVKCK